MHGGSDNGAGNEEDCQDGGESSNGEKGVQGSHHGHSRVLRAHCTRKRHCNSRVPARLCLSCGKPERRLNPTVSVAGGSPKDQKRKRADSRGEPARAQCDHWEASGRRYIHRGKVGQTLLCSSRSLRRNNSGMAPLRPDASNSQRPGHAPARGDRCRDRVLGRAGDYLEDPRRRVPQRCGYRSSVPRPLSHLPRNTPSLPTV